jgi:cellulose synthase/poly-beta-1,6-N-acetylglucosamine synthase-like glycosyltransferase
LIVWALQALALLLLLPVSVFFAEIVLGIAMPRRAMPESPARGRLAVLIPAHNEASLIVATLRSITPQLHAGDRLLVVADNCSDATASLAAEHGAQVIERRDESRRGKGFALDFGIRHLAADAPDVVVIVDADCALSADCIDRLAQLCRQRERPVQALYLMRSWPGAPSRMQIPEFSWLVKNMARPLGLHALGLPCQLMGSGMAFPFAQLRAANLATGHIVEDLKLGIDLACAGSAPLFCPEALVTSEFARSAQGAASQRTRWEHGHLGVILRDVPHLLRHALLARSVDSFALALDLAVPPLALLALLIGATGLAALIAMLLGRGTAALAIAAIDCALLGSAVLAAWWVYGRRVLALRTIPFAAVYALGKIPLYARFLVTRQKAWVRSKREGP